MGRRRDGCPCGLPADYDRCCGRFHAGEAAPTAELLMRSRYSAYAREVGAYLLHSWHSATRPAALAPDPSLRWTRLEILHTAAGGPLDRVGAVRFRATHVQHGAVGVLEEHSRFRREDDRWVYVGPVEAASPW